MEKPYLSSNIYMYNIKLLYIYYQMATLFCLWIVVIIRITSTKAH